MRLGEQKIDPIKLEQGDWVENIPEMGDLRLKVRGARNKDWVRMQGVLSDAVPRNRKIGGRPIPAEMDRIMTALLRETCLLDWGGLEGDDGAAIPYSKDKANELLSDPQYRNFRDAVIWASSVVADVHAADVEEVAKN